jgi:hypothetical protein
MLLPTTIDVIRAALKADPNQSPAERARVLALLRSGAEPQKKTAPVPDPGPRILRRIEVARRLAVSLRTVDKLPIRKVKLPGRTRAAGFLESEINGLLASKE